MGVLVAEVCAEGVRGGVVWGVGVGVGVGEPLAWFRLGVAFVGDVFLVGLAVVVLALVWWRVAGAGAAG